MDEPAQDEAAVVPYTLGQLCGYMLRLGATGFGGPAALVGYMHRDLVGQRRWISESDYKEGLALAQLAPGPLAAQLAIYLGFVHHRLLGATLAGAAFVLPSFLMVVALGWAYVRYGGLPWMQGVFYGVGACVIGIMSMSAYKLTLKNVGRDRLLWVVYLVAALATVIYETEYVALFLLAGVVVWLWRVRPRWNEAILMPDWPRSVPNAPMKPGLSLLVTNSMCGPTSASMWMASRSTRRGMLPNRVPEIVEVPPSVTTWSVMSV